MPLCLRLRPRFLEPREANGRTHHYVPQFLLKNFRGGSKPQVHVLDKHTDKAFRAAVTKVAAIKGYYDAPSDPGLSLEPGLSTLETGASASIEKIVSSKSLTALSDEDKVVIALFAAAQIVRVPHWREMLKDFVRTVREHVARDGGDPDSMGLEEPVGDQLQAESLAWFRHIPELAPYFLNKDWILYRAPVEALYISDNPLVMHNDTDHGPYGNLGLDVPGIQLYLPLSSRLALGMMSKQIRRDTEAQIVPVQRECDSVGGALM
jgi:hypothetical protein